MSGKILKKGDRLYRLNYGKIMSVITIERTTATQAIAKDGLLRFKIKLNSADFAVRIGQHIKFNTVSYRLENTELKQKLWRQNALYRIQNFDFSTLSDSDLNSLLNNLPSQDTKTTQL